MKNRDLKRQLDSIFEIKNYEFLLIFNIKKRKKYNITWHNSFYYHSRFEGISIQPGIAKVISVNPEGTGRWLMGNTNLDSFESKYAQSCVYAYIVKILVVI